MLANLFLVVFVIIDTNLLYTHAVYYLNTRYSTVMSTRYSTCRTGTNIITFIGRIYRLIYKIWAT